MFRTFLATALATTFVATSAAASLAKTMGPSPSPSSGPLTKPGPVATPTPAVTIPPPAAPRTATGKVAGPFNVDAIVKRAVAAPDGSVWVLGQRKGGTEGILSHLAEDGRLLGSFSVSSLPIGFGVDSKGDLWLAWDKELRKYGPSGAMIVSVTKTGDVPVDGVAALAVAPNDDVCVMVTRGRNRRLRSDGMLLSAPVTPGIEPLGIAGTRDGTTWLAYAHGYLEPLGLIKNDWLGRPSGRCKLGYDAGPPREIDVAPSGLVWLLNGRPEYANGDLRRVTKDAQELPTVSVSRKGTHTNFGLATDAQGNAWFISRYDATHFTLAGFKQDGTQFVTYEVPPTETLAIDKAGNFWMGTGSAVIKLLP